MAYTALYRKWRPQTFDDVQGQDHIVTTIKNQVAAGKVSHAYLFCGTRGTGKTTVAKILAKAVNCEHPVNGEPCGQCRSCRSIDEGNSMNVLEVDAASNNGVDYIRRIREEVQYAPTGGRYRVYIIDEAHMLTNNAFNAFLKTLEEPPEYVIFIFATTEAGKILSTVESRCQRYDFHRIDTSVIAARLTQMTKAEGIAIEERAVRFIAAKGEGSMRDAISLLDKCAASCFDGPITYDRVLEVLGVSDTENCSRIFRALCAGDVAEAVRGAHAAFERGIDAANFVSDMIRYLRAMMLLASSAGDEDILEMTRESIARLKQDAGLADPETVIRFLRIFSEVYGQLRSSAQRITVIEMALVRMARPEADADTGALLQRIDLLERRLARLEQGTPTPQTAGTTSAAAPALDGPAPASSEPAKSAPSSPEPTLPEEEQPFDIPYEEMYGPADLFGEEAYYAEPQTGEPALPERHFEPEPERTAASAETHAPQAPEEPGPASSVPDGDLMSHWDEIVASIGGAAFLYLKNARAELVSEDEGVVRFSDRSDYYFGASQRNLELIGTEAEKFLGKRVHFTALLDGGREEPGEQAPAAQEQAPLSHDDIQNIFGMDVESE